jgi:PE-PPE domain
MSDRKLRWLGLGLVTTAGAGVLGLSAMVNPAFAHADEIGDVFGASGTPIPGEEYVYAADQLYLDNAYMTPPNFPHGPLYPNLTTFYQGTPATLENPLAPFGPGVATPEGYYPLGSAGVHQLLYNYPTDADGFPDQSSSIGQGISIMESTIAADQAAKETPVIFGYSQSSQISSYVMQQLDPTGANESGTLYAPQFLLIGDPSNPNGGLFERFAGFETTSGQTVSDPLTLASLGYVFDSSTPADDYTTNIFSLEYDGFTDFPRYPINLLSDLNAFLGIADIHGTYLNGGVDGSGLTAQQIADDAFLLSGSEALGADTTTNYYMIDQTPPLVAALPQPLQDLLGPDLTYLINLGYGDGSLGYSVTADSPANVPTPFGLFPDVSLSTVLSTLSTDTQEGITAFEKDLADPAALLASLGSTPSSGLDFTDLLSALEADLANPTATFSDLVNAISSATSTAYSTLLPLADIGNALVTSLPSYDLSLITANLSSGDFLDAFGLPIAANNAMDTLAAGFAYEVISNAAAQISADFSGLF